MVNLKGAEVEARRGLGEVHYLSLKFSLKALPSGRSFAYEEVLDDHQEKSNNFYQCRRRNWYEPRQLLLPLIRDWGSPSCLAKRPSLLLQTVASTKKSTRHLHSPRKNILEFRTRVADMRYMFTFLCVNSALTFCSIDSSTFIDP